MKRRNTSWIPTSAIAQKIEETVKSSEGERKTFERRWYNNNFFDDGYHYRFVSRTTGRVVDLASSSETFIPYRAIPKASRQVRGVANLLVGADPVPIIYPDKINRSSFGEGDTGEPLYQEALKATGENAKRVGQWIESAWKDMEIKELLTLMVLLTAKHGVSYIQIYSDAVEEKVLADVYDAFDVYLDGTQKSIYDSPYFIKSCPVTIENIKANEYYEEEQVSKLNPDNKYASSEIKEAYMLSRFGTRRVSDKYATLLVKEAHLKEYIDDENIEQVAKDLGDEFKDFKKGDPILRHVHEAAGIWLQDKYISLPEYPYVDLRLEPGPIYQVPLIERFIPANKTLDNVMSRLERHIGTMVVGAWLKRRGENYRLNNVAGGLEIEYDAAPPAQANMQNIPAHVFQFINEINKIIEEQGSTTSALGQLPPGVKSGVAIESLKSTEYANLKIPTDQVKITVKRIAEKMIDVAADNFITPQTVYRMEDGQPDYFDVIGEKGLDTYTKMSEKKMVEIPRAVPIRKDYKVDIQIESGLGYTTEGKRNTMLQIIEYIRGLAQEGYVNPDQVQIIVKKFLDVFQYGSTQEFMDAWDKGAPPITQKQIQEMKVALMEVIRDMQKAGGLAQPQGNVGSERQAQDSEDNDILKIKTGFMEAMRDMKQKGGNNAPNQGGQAGLV